MVPVLGITQQKLMRFSTCMDKSCCCSSGGNSSIFFDNSVTTTFTGAGTSNNPLEVNVKISPDAGNTLVVRPNGLYAAGGGTPFILNIDDTASVNLEGAGTIINPLTATAKLSSSPGNILTILPDGLYAAAPVPDTPCVNSVTYGELSILMFGDGTEENPGGNLQPGCLYLINDYQSIGPIYRLEYDGSFISKTDTGELYTGEIEPLLIRAVDGFTLENWGSMSNGDEVEYDPFGGPKGAILRRINRSLNINIPGDWYAIEYIYDDTAAGGTITNQTYKVFNGTEDHGTSNFTRSSNGIYIGRAGYGNIPSVIFGSVGNAIHYNVNAYVGNYFICNTAKNISKGAFSYLDATADLDGENDYL